MSQARGALALTHHDTSAAEDAVNNDESEPLSVKKKGVKKGAGFVRSVIC